LPLWLRPQTVEDRLLRGEAGAQPGTERAPVVQPDHGFDSIVLRMVVAQETEGIIRLLKQVLAIELKV
jgi:hypothetical protein